MADRARRLGSESRPSSSARKQPAVKPEFGPAERAMAKQIRETYIAARSAWESIRRGRQYAYLCPAAYDKGTVVPKVHGQPIEGGKDKPPVWLRLAVKFVNAGVDPADFIYKLFERGDKKRPPEPEHLLDARFLAHYDKARRDENDEVIASLSIQKQTMKSQVVYWQGAGMDFVQSHSFVLLDRGIELSALFRYCLAHELRKRDAIFARIAKRYESLAAVQYVRSEKEYRSWGAFVPDEFATRSRQLYDRALRSADPTGGWSDGEEEG